VDRLYKLIDVLKKYNAIDFNLKDSALWVRFNNNVSLTDSDIDFIDEELFFRIISDPDGWTRFIDDLPF
jgi:phosphorylcholine metabolism protein LicD